ncbi:MAG: ABC transporter permease subunit [Thermoanaerobaculia bacterium]
MGRVRLSLAWKEWRQERWKLAFGSALLACVSAIGLRARLMADVDVHAVALGVGGFLLPLFAAMGLVAAERAEGSLATLLSLPVRPRAVLAVKVAVGAVVSLAPVGTALLVALAIARDRELAYAVTLRLYLAVAAVGLLTFVWTAVFSVRQPSEARAGLVGLGVLAAWCYTAPLASLTFHPRSCHWHPLSLLYFAEPWTNRASGSWHAGADWVEALLLQCGLAAVLLLWGGWRFGKGGR